VSILTSRLLLWAIKSATRPRPFEVLRLNFFGVTGVKYRMVHDYKLRASTLPF
jgi:hypothetical protein